MGEFRQGPSATVAASTCAHSIEDQGRAAPHDGTSCRPAPVAPAEFDARRHWRAFRIESRERTSALGAERLVVAGVVVAFHALLAVWIARALAPGESAVSVRERPSDDVLVVRFLDAPPVRPADAPEPPLPRTARPAAAAPASRQRPAPAPAEPPVSAAEATSEVSAARLWEAASEDLRQHAMAGRDDARVGTRSFERPAGAALGEVLDRSAELPGQRSRLDRVWAPDRESLAGELVRRATVEREFKNRWGGRFRCVVSPVTFGLPACAFGIPQEPLPDAPLAPNEAPRDGRRPLGAPRP